MKKLTIALMCFITAVSLVACGKNTEKIIITVVDGAPAVSVASLMENDNYEIKIVSGQDKAVADITNKSSDFAVLPLNTSATLYNHGLDIKLLSVNVFGVLHLVGKSGSVESLGELKNKTVYNIGKGGTPDITLKYILEQNGIEYTENESEKDNKVLLKYVSSASELVPLLKQNKAEFGVLGEPAVENAIKIVSGLTSLFDLTNEFKIVSDCEYTQAGVVVRSDFLKKNKKKVQSLYNDLSKNNEFLQNNYQEIKEVLIEKGSTLNIDFNLELIDKMNLDNKLAYGIKESVINYLTLIYGFEKNLVGGKIPGEDFFVRL